MSDRDLQDLDRSVLWHPFTQQQGWAGEDFPVIDHADNTTLYDTAGNAYIDGVSSLWCNVHGHRHPLIDQAVHDQLERVAHSTMLGLTALATPETVPRWLVGTTLVLVLLEATVSLPVSSWKAYAVPPPIAAATIATAASRANGPLARRRVVAFAGGSGWPAPAVANTAVVPAGPGSG